MFAHLIATLLTSAELPAPPPPPPESLRHDAEAEVVPNDSHAGARVPAALAGALIGGALAVGTGTAVFFAMMGSSNELDGPAVVGMALDAVGALILVPLGAWVGHQLAGGAGAPSASYLSFLMGCAAGAALSAVGGYLAFDNGHSDAKAGGIVPMTLGALTPFVGRRWASRSRTTAS